MKITYLTHLTQKMHCDWFFNKSKNTKGKKKPNSRFIKSHCSRWSVRSTVPPREMRFIKGRIGQVVKCLSFYKFFNSYFILLRKVSYLIIALTLISCHKKEEKGMAPPKVKVATAETKRMPVTINAIGHFIALNSAEIKAQVEGRLMSLHFQDGDKVNEGDLLFTIDPSPYEAERDKVIAERLQNIAKLQYAAEKVARYRTLLPENYVSQLDYIQYVTTLADLEAAVMKNEASIRLATVNLDYCYIRAPFSGITGKHLIDKGNLIANDGKTLIVLNEVDPIYVDFTVPERDYLRVAAYQTAGSDLDVEITYPEYAQTNTTAKLILIDNQVNQQTGMILLRARIDNPLHKFWPGQFIKAKVILHYHDKATVVPEAALNIGQKGRFVYVIDKDNLAEYRSVKVGATIDSEVEILEGVNSGETVITDGQINVLPKTKVEVL